MIAKKPGPKSRRFDGLIKAAVVMLALALACGLMAGCKRIDPATEATTIQGEWQVSGANMTFVITASQLKLPGDVAYDYVIDIDANTLNFNVGSITGQATYSLAYNSEGKIMLTLTETLDGVETVTTFIKISDNTAAQPVVTSAAAPSSTESGAVEGEAAEEGSAPTTVEPETEEPSDVSETGIESEI